MQAADGSLMVAIQDILLKPMNFFGSLLCGLLGCAASVGTALLMRVAEGGASGLLIGVSHGHTVLFCIDLAGKTWATQKDERVRLFFLAILFKGFKIQHNPFLSFFQSSMDVLVSIVGYCSESKVFQSSI